MIRPASDSGQPPAVVEQPAKKKIPREVAEQYGVAVETVLTWIRNGELPAINVADPASRRPRYRIDPADLVVFDRRRQVVTQQPQPKRRPRRKSQFVRLI